ncbi:MAG: hypothetical protein WC730_00085 [Patescibacteria group bacterium]|jgi:hypothetical protein
MTETKDLKDQSLLPEGGEELFEVRVETAETLTSKEATRDATAEVQEPMAEQPAEAPHVSPVPVPPMAVEKDRLTKEIEEILSNDLTDIYLTLSEDRKVAFREKGEEVAVAIHDMMKTGKLKVQKVLELILEWLRLIPGINKFFLEQEAKIKTDTIVHRWEEESMRVDNGLV